MSALPPATAATDAIGRAAAARTRAAARQLVQSEDLEEALAVAATAIGETLAGEAVLRVRATQHDLYASASGVVPPSALSALARAVLSPPLDGEATSDGSPAPEAPTSPDGPAGRDGSVSPDGSVGLDGTMGPDGTRLSSGPVATSTAGGILIESSGGHATCRVWVGTVRAPREDGSQRTVAELLLHCLAQSVDRIVTADRVRQTEANLERAVESHRLVGQAMGILIERHRITSEEAFDVLRRASQDHNVKLREVARRVIETGAEPGEVV